jgi:aspartate kinase
LAITSEKREVRQKSLFHIASISLFWRNLVLSGNKERSFPCLVAKFGGSSLANGTDILRGVRSVINEKRRGTQIAVVVSAMGKTTDRLISIAEKACGREVSPNELDDIVAMGERTTARIFTAALRSKGERSICLDPSDADWPIITDDSFNNAKPILLMCERRIKEKIQPMLEKGITVVIPGFVGRTEEELITTMGRGGSDITAMILARGLSADQVTLVTDVDGIMSADPKIIKNPKRLDNMEIDTLVGLADSGSKFVHKKALRYKSPTIDVKVINNAAGDLRAEGTTILGSFPETIAVESHPDVSMAVTIVGKAISESPETLQKSTTRGQEVLRSHPRDVHKPQLANILPARELFRRTARSLALDRHERRQDISYGCQAEFVLHKCQGSRTRGNTGNNKGDFRCAHRSPHKHIWNLHDNIQCNTIRRLEG